MIKIITSRNVKAVDRLLSGTATGDRTTAAYVAAIVSAVRRRGDRALLQYARRFDGLKEPLEVSPEEIEEGAARVPPKVREALAAAARHIQKVARRQRPQQWTVTPVRGVSVEQRVVPLDRSRSSARRGI